MPLKHSREQHREYLNMIDRLGTRWLDVFQGNTEFYSAAYWDLLVRLWRSDRPVRKTEALRFMTGIKSPHTAAKYIDTAFREGLITETENPDDARSKLVSLTPAMRRRLDGFFDLATDEVRRTARTIEDRALSPQCS